MGYYTAHTLDAKNVDISEILSDLREKMEAGSLDFHTDIFYAVNTNGEYYNETKWYDHETEMSAISRLYPDVIFELSGEGEESGDLWRDYYKNGKIQRCPAKITYDEYDESKLEVL
ncbi:hypothetical protein CN333_00155 [Bacillus thuringiensis]|uniref:hypothetical protein n=1 Tax=Bacillus thuringiensis TaxID=1428 RepID=UPI000BF8BFD9|nr:hypothetical protein [Bacillus thuringiensis]PFE80041.1 hypothetical protein CN333_00155 [Bacillus thuringiensis]